MNIEKIYAAAGELDESYIDETIRAKARPRIGRYIGAAAAALLMAGLLFGITRIVGIGESPKPVGPDTQTTAQPGEETPGKYAFLADTEVPEDAVLPPVQTGGPVIEPGYVRGYDIAQLYEEAETVCVVTIRSWLGEDGAGTYYEAEVQRVYKGEPPEKTVIRQPGNSAAQMIGSPLFTYGDKILAGLVPIKDSRYPAAYELVGADIAMLYAAMAEDGGAYLIDHKGLLSYNTRQNVKHKFTDRSFDRKLVNELLNYLGSFDKAICEEIRPHYEYDRDNPKDGDFAQPYCIWPLEEVEEFFAGLAETPAEPVDEPEDEHPEDYLILTRNGERVIPLIESLGHTRVVTAPNGGWSIEKGCGDGFGENILEEVSLFPVIGPELEAELGENCSVIRVQWFDTEGGGMGDISPLNRDIAELIRACGTERIIVVTLKHTGAYHEGTHTTDEYTWCYGFIVKDAASAYNEHDLSKIQAFLNTIDENGARNGERILEAYDPEDPESWYYYDNDGEREAGYARYITQWNDEGRLTKLNLPFPFVSLTGSLDLSGCEALDYVSLNTRGITSADVTGCPLSERFSVCDPQLSEITPSSITTPALFITECSVRHIEWNALPSADQWGADHSFVLRIDSEGEGSVGVMCAEGEHSRELVIYAYPEEGGTFIGWFDEAGELYSADRACELPYIEGSAAFTARFTVAELGCEEQVRNGEVVKLELSVLEGNGAALDIDGDGTKEILTLRPAEEMPDEYAALYVNNELKTYLSLSGEYMLVSLFGDSIQLASECEHTFVADEIRYYDGGESGEEYRMRNACEVTPLAGSRDYWSTMGMALYIPCDDATKLKRLPTIEEYLYAGAEAEACFPLMTEFDENHDITYHIDMDGDGVREELLLSAGRVLVFEQDDRDEPVYKIPYPAKAEDGEEGYTAICSEYSAKGYTAYPDEAIHITVNGAAADDGNAFFYTGKGWFIADPETHAIRYVNKMGEGSWVLFEFDKGETSVKKVNHPSA